MISTMLQNKEVHPSVLQEYNLIRTQITQSPFSYELFIRTLKLLGTIMYGPAFTLFQEDRHVLLQLYAYFSKDAGLCEFYSIQQSKGLFLSGPTGVGKTVLMKLVRHFYNQTSRYRIVACPQVSMEFMERGSNVMMYYGRNYVDFIDQNALTQSYCFDDLGTEDEVRHYGSVTNVLGQIILMRYELFQSRKVMTHFTSNLTSEQIGNHYGERVRSRLREMCNWIEYSPESRDKRH